ncbi:Phosphoinositide-binding clathrin adaptor [Vigna unguiculata]|uniref:Phosphoinositide-binding clathrin adaptor n=1 Tax=Vigna unguiculata TaxID=3917 RepID=A0A4D6LT77_VIGUN|nr:Phosphoinositide-binding clathrin adaptor [Vigna unguiculata]
MAPTTIRKAIGVVKDQTSIRIAKVAGNTAPEMEVAVVKATSHEDDPASEKYVREILNLMSQSRGYVLACVSAVSKRLGKTRDWIVALKALMLVHRLMNEGPPLFQEEILYAIRRGSRFLNMFDFIDEAHSSSWDHSAFVRTYAMYLDQRLELMLFYRKSTTAGTCGGSVGGGGADDRFGGGDNFRWWGHDMSESVTPLRDMTLDKRVFDKMDHLQRLLDRFLACRPTGLAKNSRMVFVALYHVVRESFQLYAAICELEDGEELSKATTQVRLGAGEEPSKATTQTRLEDPPSKAITQARLGGGEEPSKAITQARLGGGEEPSKATTQAQLGDGEESSKVTTQAQLGGGKEPSKATTQAQLGNGEESFKTTTKYGLGAMKSRLKRQTSCSDRGQ